MTRETKIGLLVGLAFIIVIGILLSDHMTSTNQPPQAALVESAPNVRESVTAPSGTGPLPAPLVNVPPITPANPVPTQQELRQPVVVQQTPPVMRVEIGGPAVQQPAPPIAIRQSPEAPIVAIGPVSPQQPVTQPPADATSELEQWASRQGEPLVRVGSVPPPAAPTEPATAKREYVAQAGDNLSKIAAKMLGSNTKANRDAIVKANPALQKNPDIVVEGRKYVIPQPGSVASPAAPAAPVIPETVPVASRPIPVTELVAPLPARTPAQEGGYWYVVKENDNLWKIAAEQLGSGNAWQQIKELNKDVLKGGDTVQPNMRLRLPAKPFASAE